VGREPVMRCAEDATTWTGAGRGSFRSASREPAVDAAGSGTDAPADCGEHGDVPAVTSPAGAGTTPNPSRASGLSWSALLK